MNPIPPSRRPLGEYCAVLARWVVGGLFLVMGWNKAVDPVDFLKLVRQYDLLHAPWLLNTTAAVLPWFEMFCGVLLLLGVAVRGTALVSLAMLAPFTVIVYRRTLEIQAAKAIPFCAVKFDCGCGAGEVWICYKLAENLGLMLLCAWLVTGRGRPWATRFELWPARPASG